MPIVSLRLLLRWLFLGTLNALGLLSLAALLSQGQLGIAAGLALGLLVTNIAILSRRAYPLRYLLPGLVFFAAFVVYPMVYTVALSFTNYGGGHLLSKQQVIEQITRRMERVSGAPTFEFWAYRDPTGEALRVLLRGPEGKLWLSSPHDHQLEPIEPTDPRLLDEDGDGIIDAVDGWPRLTGRALVRELSRLERLIFLSPLGGDNEVLKLASPRMFAVFQLRYRYDPERDAIIDLQNGTIYYAQKGFFVSAEGERLLPGFPVWVGWENYRKLLQNPQIMRPFLRVFLWTFAFAALTVLTTFALGLLLAIVLNDRHLVLRPLYRTLLILPWAIPAFISVMVWRGLLNPIGPVNRTLEAFLGISVEWLTDAFWAKASVLLVNLWLGFPYMMTISLGALQSIPDELYEAALVDGATPWQRFWNITLPLLLVAVGPLLVGSFAFNFNNFNLIFLLTGGGPPIPGAQTPAGATDILISYTYKLAFSGGWGQQFGLAAAISTVIFLIVGTISAINFKFTGALEEVSENV